MSSAGCAGFIRPRAVFADRVLATVMLADLVASTRDCG